MEKIIPGHENYDEFNKRTFTSEKEFKDFFSKARKVYFVPSEYYENGDLFNPELKDDTICFGNLWVKAKSNEDVTNILKFKNILDTTCEVEYISIDISLDQELC